MPASPDLPPLETSLHELLETMQAPSEPATAGLPACPACRLAGRAVERRIRLLFAEFVNDPEARDGFRRSRGFCPAHIPLVATLGDSLAVAILYADLAERARARLLAERKPRFVPGGRAARAWAPCPACAADIEAGERYTQALAAALEREDIWPLLIASPSICLRHMEMTLAAAKPAAADRLRRLESERLMALQAELEEIVRKSDYRLAGEPWGAERDAWQRALNKLARPRDR